MKRNRLAEKILRRLYDSKVGDQVVFEFGTRKIDGKITGYRRTSSDTLLSVETTEGTIEVSYICVWTRHSINELFHRLGSVYGDVKFYIWRDPSRGSLKVIWRAEENGQRVWGMSFDLMPSGCQIMLPPGEKMEELK